MVNPNIIYEQLREYWTKSFEGVNASLGIARNIYLSNIRLLTTLSAALLPLVGLLISFGKNEEVKSLILGVIIFLFLTITFGIIALIRLGLFFKNEANEIGKKIGNMTEIMNEGPKEIEEKLESERRESREELKKGNVYKDVEYKWHIFQLISFVISIILLVSSLFIML